MKRGLAVAALVCLFGCESVTTGTNTPWGPINGVNFVPGDAFFIESVQANGDYNLVLFVADRTGYCDVLKQNLAGYPSNIAFATFTFSNPIGTGPVDPGPGTYPVTLAYGNASSAQASYQTVSNCTASTPLAGTSGSVVMSALATDGTAMAGTVDVGFDTAGTLRGAFSAPLCDTSNATSGPSQCYQ